MAQSRPERLGISRNIDSSGSNDESPLPSQLKPHAARRVLLRGAFRLCPDDCDGPIDEVTQPNVAARRIQILIATTVQLDTSYSRTLPERSVWSRMGRVPQGDVYRPIGTIFTIEGRQVHEAYLVIRDKTLVGFYLPGEQNYSPLSTAVPLNLGESE
ncbi:hypothetical protein [Cupriavidus sp. AcVe19-6a]|uniref:hypothetical protein n=1 Tax=Cupriavidus sp. AcVe19-6a TaxID=2821358 RepID=UPI001FD7BF74|nr:hypothetical protein [Cupriavidus sp. AcVe19-6a]